jgi:hypothetical protein
MFESVRPTAPFYKRKSPAPPSLPLLVAQTDIFYHVVHPSPLLAQVPFPQARPTYRTNHTPDQTRTKSVRMASLPPISSLSITSTATSIHGTDTDALQSGLESEESVGGSAPAPVRLVPAVSSSELPTIGKPAGENGRPGRGGYSVSRVMVRQGWRTKSVLNLKVSAACLHFFYHSDLRLGSHQKPCS